jgi:ubiquinone/menaquinone biosynthesis C-methylase UbiE
MIPVREDVRLQRAYYTATAGKYDQMHGCETSPLALAMLSMAIALVDAESVLDVGSGTGRVLHHVRARHRDVKAVGLEPVAALREQGIRSGIPPDILIDGDATRMAFGDGAFDVVCAFAALHHIPMPELAIDEMMRVAGKAILIADANNFGAGKPITRAAKQVLDTLTALACTAPAARSRYSA